MVINRYPFLMGKDRNIIKYEVQSSPEIQEAIFTRIIKAIDEQASALLFGIVIGAWLIISWLKLPEKIQDIEEKVNDIHEKIK